MGFSISLEDTFLCGLERSGIEPPTVRHSHPTSYQHSREEPVLRACKQLHRTNQAFSVNVSQKVSCCLLKNTDTAHTHASKHNNTVWFLEPTYVSLSYRRLISSCGSCKAAPVELEISRAEQRRKTSFRDIKRHRCID